MSDFVSSDETLRAELIWVLKMNSAHFSYKSSEDSALIFRTMFPDSQIASKFSCGERKANYIMRFGLAPHFQNIQMKSLKEVSAFVLLFDESYNPVTKDKQMDIHVRYWSTANAISSRYVTSVFMGHGRSDDLLTHFLSVTEDLNLSKALQVSMDGPNVNWAFYNQLQKKIKLDHNTQMLNIGSCGLHIIHGAFKHGVDKCNWDMTSLLRSVHSMFNETPARREDYTEVTGSSTFGRNFCNTRWLENVPVAERVLEMWGSIKVYVAAARKGTVPLPKTKAFACIKEATEDPLTEVKLQVFISIAKIITPFLTIYQTDRVMIPFLASDLHKLLK